MRAMCHGPGVQVVALVPVAGPVPPPIIVVTPLIERIFDLLRADEVDVRIDGARGHDQALARDHLGPGPITMFDRRLDVRIAGLADRRDAAVLEADVGLDDAPVIEDHGVGDDGVDDLGGRRAGSGPCRRE